MWGQIGAATIGGLVRGYYSEKNSKRQAKTAEKNLEAQSVTARVADAKRAGVHPLMALGSNVSPSPLPTLSGSAVGDALSSGIEEWGRQRGQLQDKKEQEQVKALEQTRILSDTTRSRAEARYFNAQADYVQGALTASTLARATQGANNRRRPIDPNPKPDKITGTAGGKFKTSASTSAEEIEQAYGGLIGELYGISRMVSDGWDHYSSKWK